MPPFQTKDSGEREAFMSGMVRDVQKGKPRYDLLDRAFLRRWAELMARGAEKYGEENWRKATGEAELKRFKASALRHLMQWMDDEHDEDHAAAVAFNLAGAEMVKEKLKNDADIRIPVSAPPDASSGFRPSHVVPCDCIVCTRSVGFDPGV